MDRRPLIDTKRLLVSWCYPWWRRRLARVRLDRRHAHSLYVQIGPLEIVVWYR